MIDDRQVCVSVCQIISHGAVVRAAKCVCLGLQYLIGLSRVRPARVVESTAALALTTCCSSSRHGVSTTSLFNVPFISSCLSRLGS